MVAVNTCTRHFTPYLLSWFFETLGKAGDSGDLCHGVSVELVVDLQHQGSEMRRLYYAVTQRGISHNYKVYQVGQRNLSNLLIDEYLMI